MQPKFDIGLFVKGINEEQEMMIITVINESGNLGNPILRPSNFNGKYKCAWIKEHKVILKVFDESELTLA
ncbi:MAG: hypothetical protein JWR61_4523 [Ferruginibacter sp.]|uniref:hypothetical protein n=1 Tax=Ferruginibacter sp. TaxID=1940288 RepID=UPI00265B3A88|nr:hypothetical protein [Ferruginibacter sp.]MDB5279568.1 hypothetical protein [Ferruginibacter sp.]